MRRPQPPSRRPRGRRPLGPSRPWSSPSRRRQRPASARRRTSRASRASTPPPRRASTVSASRAMSRSPPGRAPRSTASARRSARRAASPARTGSSRRRSWPGAARRCSRCGAPAARAARPRRRPTRAYPACPCSRQPLRRCRSPCRGGVSAVVIGPQATAPAASPSVADRAAFAHPAQSPAAAVPIRPAEPPAHDNLQRIGGVTAEVEQRLNALGVARYSEIAHWSPTDVERIDKELGLGGRISRGNWIEQAHILSRGGDTVFSRDFDRHGSAPAGPPPRPIKLPDAIRAHEEAKAAGRPTDLSGLRSVRSEAYQDTTEPGPEAARRAAGRKLARTGPPDDLKRIRGIGVLIERKLNALGVTDLRGHRPLDERGHRPRQPAARFQGPHPARGLGGAGPHPRRRRRHRVLPPPRPARRRRPAEIVENRRVQ